MLVEYRVCALWQCQTNADKTEWRNSVTASVGEAEVRRVIVCVTSFVSPPDGGSLGVSLSWQQQYTLNWCVHAAVVDVFDDKVVLVSHYRSRCKICAVFSAECLSQCVITSVRDILL